MYVIEVKLMMNLNKKKLSLLSKIDNLYIEKAKGAYVRSGARWIEKGEKSNSSFFRFEKRRQEHKYYKFSLLMEL